MSTSQFKVDSIFPQHYIHNTEGTDIGLAVYHGVSNPSGLGNISGMSQVNRGNISISNNGVKLDQFELYDTMSNRTIVQNTFRTQKDYTNNSDNDTYLNLSNTFFAVHSGTYKFRSLVDNVDIYVNKTSLPLGTPTLTLTNAYTSTGNITLGGGDRVFANGPIRTTYTTSSESGSIPMYGGWAGYTFATRMDRGSNISISIKVLDDDTDIDLFYTTGNNLVTTALTQQNSWTSQSAGAFLSSQLVSTRNYYLISTKPIVAYRGIGQDKMPLYPMYPNETLYGFFSQGGHILNIPSAIAFTKNSAVGGPAVSSANSSGSSTIEFLNIPSQNAPYVYTEISPTYTSGGNFSGPAAKVYPNLSNAFDMSIAAEQQADGDGGEMTPFVGSKALGCGIVLCNTAQHLACVSSSDGGFHIINTSNTVVYTGYFTGSSVTNVWFNTATNTSYLQPGYRALIFNTSGSYINTGQFYADIDASAGEETVFYMTRESELKTNVTLTYTYNWDEFCYETPENACSFGEPGEATITITESSPGSINPYNGNPSVGDITTLNEPCTYSIQFGTNFYAISVNSSGIITAVQKC